MGPAVDSLAARRAEALEFIRLLTHDDRSSYYVISRVVDGKWVEGRGVSAADLEAVDLGRHSPAYLSRNGFTSRRRLSGSCRQVNALLYDIDCHKGGSRDNVTTLLDAVQTAAVDGTIPSPTMLIDTGRGIHVYYVLKKSLPTRVKDGASNKAGMSLLRRTEHALGEAIRRIIPDTANATLDTTAYDLARVSRIPGSYNDKAGRWCHLVSNSGTYYSLGELLTSAGPSTQQTQEPNWRKRFKSGSPSPIDPMTRRMLSRRLTLLERLQDLRANDCVGSREMICFLYYNTAKQLYSPKTSARMLNRLNARFTIPLPQAEIMHAIESVNRAGTQRGDRPHDKGYYIMRETTFLAKLELTDDERTVLCSITSKQEMRRRKKEATAAKKKKRDDRIAALYEIGYDQPVIAKMTRCCTRTVAKVIKRRGVTKGDLETQQEALHEQTLKNKRTGGLRMHIPAPESLCDAFLPSPFFLCSYLWSFSTSSFVSFVEKFRLSCLCYQFFD